MVLIYDGDSDNGDDDDMMLMMTMHVHMVMMMMIPCSWKDNEDIDDNDGKIYDDVDEFCDIGTWKKEEVVTMKLTLLSLSLSLSSRHILKYSRSSHSFCLQPLPFKG